MTWIKWLLILVVLIGTIYFSGPKPKHPLYTDDLPSVPTTVISLENYITKKESGYAPLKSNNEAKIQWYNDSIKSKTKYALVYLHGFSASHEEGNPIYQDIATKYGMNIYLSRLSDHGRIKQEPLSEFTAQQAWDDAKEAYAIGKMIGEKVILLSTSTGGTLSLLLTAHFTDIHAQILLSPNIEIKDPSSFLLNNPWGLQIARKVIGSEYNKAKNTTIEYAKYWDPRYRIEALIQLEELIESSMVPNNFKKINQPTLLLYYYKNEAQQDDVVSVDAMKKMYTLLSTPENKKREKALPHTGDHVLGSNFKSHDLESVRKEIFAFLDSTL